MINNDNKLHALDHYKMLLFLAFNRSKGKNIYKMRPYFCRVMMTDIEEYMPLHNKSIIDVGGGRGEYCRILSEGRDCDAVNLDPYPYWELRGEDHVSVPIWPKTVIGFADSMPFKDNEFDLVILRGVLEHIPPEKQQNSLNELYRVTKIEGICYIVIPPWYNPHAGHQLRPFHVFPFKIARFLKKPFLKRGGRVGKVDSYDELGLYRITVRKMLQMISLSNFNVVALKDTHLRLHFLTKIPLIRELVIPAMTFILQKSG